MTASLTERGTFSLAGHEGFVPCRYYDDAGVPTVYIGHTRSAGSPDPMSIGLQIPNDLDQAIDAGFDLFENDLITYAAAIDRHMGPMKPHERDGWTSWHFNTGGVFTSSAVDHWRAGRKQKAVQVMQSWNKITVGDQKRVSKGLVKRRKEEAAMILRGVYPKRDVPVWATDGNGRVDFRAPLDLLDFEEVKRLAFVSAPESFFDRLWQSLGWFRWWAA